MNCTLAAKKTQLKKISPRKIFASPLRLNFSEKNNTLLPKTPFLKKKIKYNCADLRELPSHKKRRPDMRGTP